MKRNNPEVFVTKLRQFELLVGQEMMHVDAIREGRATEQTRYRCFWQYSVAETNRQKDLIYLQNENERLNNAVSAMTLDKPILNKTAREKF